jgi:hypothetical protein
MQHHTYLYCLGIYGLLAYLIQICTESCEPNVYCSSLIATTSFIMQFRSTVVAFQFVGSSCRILNSYTSWPLTAENCAGLAWSAAGGTYVFNSYIREHPGTLTQWIRVAKSVGTRNGGGNVRQVDKEAQSGAGEERLEV